MQLPRIRRWLVALSAAVATMVVSSAALACSCLDVNVAPEDFLREVDMIFAGTMVSKRPGDTDDCREGCTIGTFQVESPLKGKVGDTVEIRYYASEGTSCEWGLPLSKRVTVAAYGDAGSGYYADHCSQYVVRQGQSSGEIWDLAVKNRERTDALARSARDDTSAQLELLRWLSEYRANEEGLDAADNLLAREPRNREALLFKEGFLSGLGRDAEALGISNDLLAHDTADATAAHRRALALVRLGRMSEIPEDWRNFDGLQAEGIDFSNRTLSHATFRNARIDDFKFTNADLSQADFSGTTFNGADFKGANLAGANFAGVDGALDLSSANVSGADFTSANLGWVLFIGTTAQGAILNGSCMEGDFKGVDLTSADLRNAQLRSDHWSGAILRNADLRAALLGASVAEIDVTGARYNDFTWPAPADLQRHGAVRVDDADPNQPPVWLPCPRY